MKEKLSQWIYQQVLSVGLDPEGPWVVEEPKIEAHGDFSTNVAMVLAKSAKRSPRELAQVLSEGLAGHPGVERVEIKGPGFLNFFLKPKAFHEALTEFWEDGQLKLPQEGQGKRVLIEFVSANPTGPMHVGHGRNAVVGDALARLFKALGYEVTREFYVNDHGVQIQTLGHSGKHYHRILLNLGGVEAALPDDMYRGEYIEELVEELHEQITPIQEDPMAVGKLLGLKLLEKIREDLSLLNVNFDHYFSESSLYEAGEIEKALQILKEKGKTYEEEGALWFCSTQYGDDKDRVLIKKDGAYTYFTPDIAYHLDKFERSFDLYLNVMGADHGGYVKRMKAAVTALGYDAAQLEFVLMQLVSLRRGAEKVAMSKRSGDYVTLREVVEEVGVDAARFFFLLRSHHTTLEFDLELAKQQNAENPVYYVQYAHARMCSIFAKAAKGQTEGLTYLQAKDLVSLEYPEELALIKKLLTYPQVLHSSVQEREPHRVVFYLLELAKIFQNYYTQGKGNENYRVLTDKSETTRARLYLIHCLKNVFHHGLELLGVSAPEAMFREN